MSNILSAATLAHLYAIDPVSARALEQAGDLTPRRTRRAPRRAVIDNRRLLVIMQNGRNEPAGDEVIDGEYDVLD